MRKGIFGVALIALVASCGGEPSQPRATGGMTGVANGGMHGGAPSAAGAPVTWISESTEVGIP
jgi:hypothetical protein